MLRNFVEGKVACGLGNGAPKVVGSSCSVTLSWLGLQPGGALRRSGTKCCLLEMWLLSGAGGFFCAKPLVSLLPLVLQGTPKCFIAVTHFQLSVDTRQLEKKKKIH